MDTALYTTIPIYQTIDGKLFILPWHFLHRGKTTDFVDRLETEATVISWDELKNTVDFIYLAVHGRYAEDGTVQGMLEILGIPYLGSGVFASALCMDKHIQQNIIANAGIMTPKGHYVDPITIHALLQGKLNLTSITDALASKSIGFPVMVKPIGEGSSIGVCIAHDETSLLQGITRASQVGDTRTQGVLLEEKIIGMEFSCIILADKRQDSLMALPPTEIAQLDGNSFFDYEQKYMPGRALEHTPPRCSQEHMLAIQECCKHVVTVLGIDTIGRVDGFLLVDGRVCIIEANTLSGMGPASLLFRAGAEAGFSHTDLINYLIETDLCRYGIRTAIPGSTQEQEKTMETINKKIRVAVLFGGQSHEKEISLESGRNVIYKLSPDRYTVIPLFVSSRMTLHKLTQSLLVRNSTAEIEHYSAADSAIAWSELPDIADFAFIALHGGRGENGAVQGALEMLGMPYNGSGVLASALCMDKYKTAEFLKHHGIDVPRSRLVARDAWKDTKLAVSATIEESIGLPVIVKPHDDGCSVLVCKAKTTQDSIDAIDAIFADGKTHALVEEYIVGTELTIGVVGNSDPIALPPSKVVASGDILSIEEKFLPGAGENQTPAPLPAPALKLAQDIVTRAYTAVGCKGYVRIDCFYQDAQQSPTGVERCIILEINTLPALTPATCLFHQAAEIGIKPMDFIDLIIQLGLQNHATKETKLSGFACLADWQQQRASAQE